MKRVLIAVLLGLFLVGAASEPADAKRIFTRLSPTDGDPEFPERPDPGGSQVKEGSGPVVVHPADSLSPSLFLRFMVSIRGLIWMIGR